MKILYDDNMPYAHECFSLVGNAEPFNAKSLDPHELVDTDALICRSTLKVNRDLLRYSTQLKMVATATAGFNHLDTHYLHSAGIPWFSAAGCNAVAVAEFVINALFALHRDCSDPIAALQKLNVGIVGAGNVGTALSQKLDAINVTYKLCDPPLAESGDQRGLVSLNAVLACDVICLHVPLVSHGEYPTERLIGHNELAQLTDKQVVINACRGGVLDEAAYMALSKHQSMPRLVLDAWCNEPAVDQQMLNAAWIATPHIAGHSLEGKARGTFMAYESLTQLLDKNTRIQLHDVLPTLPSIELNDVQMQDPKLIPELIFSLYDIQLDDRHFRRLMAQSESTVDTFMLFRANYPVRREYSAQKLVIPESCQTSENTRLLHRLGFQVCTSTA